MNVNQEGLSPVHGQIDNQTAQGGRLPGRISPDETGTPVAGAKLKLDSTNKGPIPYFLLAAASDVGIGFLPLSINTASPVAGSFVEAIGVFGPCMWLTANAEVTPGASVEMTTGAKVQATSSGKQVGIALTYAAATGLCLVMLTAPMGAAS